MEELGFGTRIRIWLSPRYRREIIEKQKQEMRNERLALGHKLWKEAEQNLPPAHGVIEDDVPRIEAFKSFVAKLNAAERYALRSWLKSELQGWKHNFCEITTGLEEQYEQRVMQILREHLSVLNSTS